MKNYRLSLILGLLTLSAFSVFGSEIDWGTGDLSTSIADSSGTLLPVGDLVEVGTITLSAAQITAASSAGDFATLSAAFQPFATSTIGDFNGAPLPISQQGNWIDASVASSTTANGFSGAQIYYLIYNAPTAGAATQGGIFTDPNSASWKIPDDSAVPNLTVTDLSDVPTTTAGLIYGGYGMGVTNWPGANGAAYDLKSFSAVPEPSTFGLIGCGVALLPFLRRRKA